jgi:succinoglycan biosynthesis protein ExoA
MAEEYPPTLGADILIAIPCLNEEAMLPALLEGLIANAATCQSLIVVIDGGSTDQTRAIADDFATRFPGRVVRLDNPKRYQSAALNLAAQTLGEGRSWLARVDAHCHYPSAYVSALRAAAQRTGADSVVVPMVAVGKGCFQRAVAAAQNSKLGTGGSAHRHAGAGQWVDHGHHALINLAKFNAVGGYDDRYTHNEDAELDLRLTQLGCRIWLEGPLTIDYVPRNRASSLARQYWNYGRGRAQTVLQHRSKLKLRQTLPLFVAPALFICPLGLIFPPLTLPLALWLGLCLLVGAGVGLRERSPCAVASGVPAAIMHMAWSLGFWSKTLERQGPNRVAQ